MLVSKPRRCRKRTYCDTNRHTQATEEAIHASSHGTVLDFRYGLYTDVDAGQDHTGANAEKSKSNSNEHNCSMSVEEDEETAGDCCYNPAEPDSPPESSHPCGQGCDNDGSRNKETHGREQVDTCVGW